MKKYVFSWSHYVMGEEVVFAENEEKAKEIFSIRALHGTLQIGDEVVLPKVEEIKEVR